jgi:hypothetical protein
MVKKTVSLLALLIAISALTFIAGFVAGNLTQTYSSNLALIETSQLAAESAALEYSLIQKYDVQTCGYLGQRQDALADELATLGQTLSKHTIKTELPAGEYNLLKRQYHMLQIRSYLQTQRLMSLCNQTTNIILFYYDDPADQAEYIRNPEYYARSKQQGLILDSIVESHNVTVYAIELDYAPELAFLEDFYNVTRAPTLIVNYQYKLEGLAQEEDILSRWNTS